MPAGFSPKSTSTGLCEVCRRYPTNPTGEIGSEKVLVEQKGNLRLEDNIGKRLCPLFKREAEYTIGTSRTTSRIEIMDM